MTILALSAAQLLENRYSYAKYYLDYSTLGPAYVDTCAIFIDYVARRALPIFRGNYCCTFNDGVCN